MAIPQLKRQQLPYLLGAILAASLLILDELQQRSAANHPRPVSSPSTSTSRMTSRKSLRTHARRGALKEAFGRCTISRGSQLSAARLSATLPWPSPDLRAAADRERRPRNDGVDEGNTHLDGGRHARPVRIGKIQSWHEQARIGQAHAINLVWQRVVVVDVAVLLHGLVHIAQEVRAEEGGQLVGAIEGVAAAKPWLLRQLGEGQEPLRPSRSSAGRGLQR